MGIIYCDIGKKRTKLAYGGCPNDHIDKDKPIVDAGRRVPCPKCEPGKGANSIIHGASLGDIKAWNDEQDRKRQEKGELWYQARLSWKEFLRATGWID